MLASNLYVLHPTPHDYFQPAVVISGGLTGAGRWPRGCRCCCGSRWRWSRASRAARAFARRSLTGLWPRRAALVLILFFGCFTVIFGTSACSATCWPGFLSWGYTFGLIALAALAGGLLTYDGVARGPDQLGPRPARRGASLLHPWQGEALIVLVAGELVARARAAGHASTCRAHGGQRSA